MPKLNTRNCSTFVNIGEKIRQFLSSVKRDAHKRKLVPFLVLTVYVANHVSLARRHCP